MLFLYFSFIFSLINFRAYFNIVFLHFFLRLSSENLLCALLSSLSSLSLLFSLFLFLPRFFSSLLLLYSSNLFLSKLSSFKLFDLLLSIIKKLNLIISYLLFISWLLIFWFVIKQDLNSVSKLLLLLIKFSLIFLYEFILLIII